jgi:hypothetical protein
LHYFVNAPRGNLNRLYQPVLVQAEWLYKFILILLNLIMATTKPTGVFFPYQEMPRQIQKSTPKTVKQLHFFKKTGGN